MDTIAELKRRTAELEQATQDAITACLVRAVAEIDEALPHMTNGQLGSVRASRRTLREIILARGGICPVDPIELTTAGAV